MKYERSWKDYTKDALALCVAFGMAGTVAWLFYRVSQ